MPLKFIVDENMPFGREVFSRVGEVVTLPGRKITRDDLRGADALLVRSVTRVTPELLEGTPVKFVGTATIGEEHVDKDYLAIAGIGFSSAPGCNANSVSEWFTAAVLHAADILGLELSGCTLGIIGVGNVGRRVSGKARALGMRVMLNDPPREKAEKVHRGFPLDEGESLPFHPLEEILAEADIITVHVPLTRNGRYATADMFDSDKFSAMKTGMVFINASRGGVIDEKDLRQALETKNLRAAMLDVWRDEPDISPETLSAALLGTPHIAGYSLDGKINGTAAVFEACMKHLGIDSTWDRAEVPPPVYPEIVTEISASETEQAAVRRIVHQAYNIIADDARLRGIFRCPFAGRKFDTLRKTYPVRREWHNTKLRLRGGSERLREILSGLGFQCLA